MAVYGAVQELSGWPGGPGTNTVFFKGRAEAPGEASQTTANAVATLFNQFRTDVMGTVSSIVASNLGTPIIARNETTGEAIAEFAVSGDQIFGSGLGDLLPPSQCIVIGWRTAVPSRRFRGRTFVGPLTEPANDVNGSPTAAAITSVQTSANNLITAVGGQLVVDLVVWSRPVKDPVTGAITRQGAVQNVTSAAIRDIWASLRSRRD